MRATHRTHTPFAPLSLFDDVRQAFDVFFPAASPWLREDLGGISVSIVEHDDAYELSADLPGVRAEDLNLQIHGDQLTLGAQRQPQAPEGFEARRREREALRFERRYTLPEPVDADAVTASLRDGVLSVRLPKRPERQPRTIPVVGR